MITSFRAPARGAERSRTPDFPSAPSETVRLLPAAAFDGRLRRLHSACELLADGFDGLDEQIAAYVASTRIPNRDRGSADADRFLDWLERQVELSDEQRDFVAALRGRRAVEFVAVKQRLAHARFQDLLQRSNDRIDQLEVNSDLSIYLNPIHVWSQFETHALLEEEIEIPATVLFVPCGSDIRTVVIEAPAKELIEDLEARGPQKIRHLLRRLSADGQRELLALVRQLAAVGIVALA